MRILIVEDERTLRKQLEKHLEFMEPEVVVVVATPVDYLVDLVLLSFGIQNLKYLKKSYGTTSITRKYNFFIQ